MNLKQKYLNLTYAQRQTTKSSIIGFVVIFGGGFGIWNGYDVSHAQITGCHVQTEAYVTGNFEEDYTTTCTSTDMDGNLVTEICTETDYWSKPASAVWTVTSSNGADPVFNAPQEEVYQSPFGFYKTNVPVEDPNYTNRWSQHDWNHHEYNSNTYNESHTVYMLREGESDHVSKNPSFYPVCNQYREQGNSIKVKTWYNISYNVEEFTE